MTAALPPPPLTAAALTRRHFATPEQPLPDAAPGISWIVAANGIFKRGVNDRLDLLIRVAPLEAPIAGLSMLLPHVRWAPWPQRLPAGFLTALLGNARQAMSAGALARPVEKQYFIVFRDGGPHLITPRGQDATAGRVSYVMPVRGSILVDLHSHHELPAFFSQVDDRDDVGLSVSVVVGRIFTRPELACRLNVYGARQIVPATLIFDGLGPFRDTLGGHDADLAD